MSFFTTYKVTKPLCTRCTLKSSTRQAPEAYTGNGKQKILIILDNQFEDSNSYLFEKIHEFGYNVPKDCWVAGVVKCPTQLTEFGKYASLTEKQIKNCNPHIKQLLSTLKPDKVFLCGEQSLLSYFSDITEYITGIEQVHGYKIWDAGNKTWVFPLYNPQVVGDRHFDRNLNSEWDRCIKRALIADPSKFKKEWNPIHKLVDFDEAIEALSTCLKTDHLIAFDYETTGLNPYVKGHKICSFSWANGKGAWAVPVQHPHWQQTQQEAICSLIRKILSNRVIKKIVHNITYEFPWTQLVLGATPRGFYHDTQLAAHVLDNRSSITKLKFQAMVRWGVTEYEKDSAAYIKSAEGSDFNNMMNMPVDKLLEYNAFDALYTYELFREQMAEFMDEKEFSAYRFLHKGQLYLNEMSLNGISVDSKYYEEQRAQLLQEQKDLIKSIYSTAAVRKYEHQFEKFDYNSPKDLQKLLFDILKLPSTKKTKTGDSVDEETLKKINSPLTLDIIKVRKINKMISTYIDGFNTPAPDGRIHPSFGLSIARTFRSSSSNPNFQNIPKRDPQAKKIVRSGMVPSKDCVLGELDFAGAEISTSVYYHRDPTFTEYQTNPAGGDMHRDAAAEILMIEKDEVLKEIRQATKGCWTFAQFYGSYYASCARKVWEEFPQIVDKTGKEPMVRGVPISVYLKDRFGSLQNLEQHLKQFEYKFWNVWFPQYAQWRKDMIEFYIQNGYIQTYLGFVFRGRLDKNCCFNYPIQGTSFHLLLHTAVEVMQELKRLKMKTKVIGQIHDSLVLDIHKTEIQKVYSLLTETVGTLHKTFTWMTFPMGLDFEISALKEDGGSFAKMTNYTETDYFKAAV